MKDRQRLAQVKVTRANLPSRRTHVMRGEDMFNRRAEFQCLNVLFHVTINTVKSAIIKLPRVIYRTTHDTVR